MLHQELPYESRAEFLSLNVCDFPGGLSAERISHPEPELIINGLQEFRRLLLLIYKSASVYGAADPLESYHHLTDTLLFLYMAGITGECKNEGESYYLSVDKSSFTKVFKKPPAFQFEALQNYSFYFEYLKNDKEVNAYKSCDSFTIHYENASSFIPALKYLLANMPAVDNKNDYALATDLFSKADFSAILLKESIKRQDINPSRTDILRSAGNAKDLWESIVSALNGKYKLKTKCNLWSYCSPHWVIHFMNKSKAVCIFTVIPSDIDFEMSLPLEKSKVIVSLRKSLAPSVCQSIERLRCINCGKCKGTSIEIFDGVRLCSLNTEARRLYIKITSQDEIDGIAKMIDIILK